MTANDLAYFRLCHNLGFVTGTFLEIGAAKVQGGTSPNFRDVAEELGLKTTGVDLDMAPGVDYTFDFSISDAAFEKKWNKGTYDTVVIFNVLEHTFDPAQVLRNASKCVAPGGNLVVLVPSIWPIHSYPKDHVRLLPNWFEEFGQRENLELERNAFRWVSDFGMQEVASLREGNDYSFPNYQNSSKSTSPVRYWTSRLLHRAFNTYGRDHQFTYACIGAVYKKPAA